MSSKDVTKKVDRIALSKFCVRAMMQSRLEAAKEGCLRRMSGTAEKPLVEILLRDSDLCSYYPQLGIFMPKIEWLISECHSRHSREHCEKEVNAINAMANIIQSTGSSISLRIMCLESGRTFSSLVNESVNTDNEGNGPKLLKESCTLSPVRVSKATGITGIIQEEFLSDVISFLYWKDNGHIIPVIVRDGVNWKRTSPENAFSTLLKTGLETKDRELDPLIAEYEVLESILSNEGNFDWKGAVDYLGEDDCFSDVLLHSEEVRMNHQPLPPKVLTDPNLGHWDAWPNPQLSKDCLEIPVTAKIYGRNPRVDVCKTDVVGIDFGTKSTTVSRWSGRQAEVLRIGLDDFAKAPEAKHYENPTMMEFVDINSFVAAYSGDSGRPYTSWKDLKTAHEARGDLDGLGTNDVELSQAFFSGLKQWAGYGDRKIIINDKTCRCEKELVPYAELKDGDFDPIEIYAYHIGLAVNNMSERKIALRYLLSFPATFSRDVQKRILQSFRRGIRRSLPRAILSDKDIMKGFRVDEGASEPAAYAICALKELKLEPSSGRAIPYAVFDFGGGTTDFDFGFYRQSSEEELNKEDMDYVVEQFGSGGDKFLGGENLLEDIAYLTYVANRDVMVTADLKYPLAPPHDDIPLHAGYESLLVNSREGRMNLYRLSEALRPVWEENPNVRNKEIESGEIRVSLFDLGGGKSKEVKLKIDVERLKSFIRRRIEKCVDGFVESMLRAFSGLPEEKKNMLDCPIHIFLAGNSSKSLHVRALFEGKLKEIEAKFEECLKSEMPEDGEMFKLHDPLGQAAPDESGRCDLSHRPTGKTGVAFGLVAAAPGRRIKVVNANRTSSGEAHFRYFAGAERRGKLLPVLNIDSLGGGWVDFCSADNQDEIAYLYYTASGRGATGEMSTSEESVWCEPIEFMQHKGGRILIRASGPSEIEWCYGYVGEDGKAKIGNGVRPLKVVLKEGR